jgi:predicted dehydrogenase
MAVTLEQLERLRKTQARTGARLCPMLPYRYHPEFWAAYRAIKEGLVGEPLLLMAQKSYKLGARHLMYTRRTTYGGTIPWVAIHAIDWIHWFTGGGISEVAASHTTRGNGGHGEMESSAVCFYRLSNSGVASVSCDFFRPKACPTHGDDRIRVAGEMGIVEVRDGEALLVASQEQPRFLEKEDQVPIFQDFVRHVETGEAMRISPEEAFAVSELALRSREAADSKKMVKLR